MIPGRLAGMVQKVIAWFAGIGFLVSVAGACLIVELIVRPWI